MKRTTVNEIIRLLFILLFVYAAASKLIDYRQFRVQLGQSPLLSSFPGFIAWFIPVIESGIAICLCTIRFRLTGLYASFSLMTLFTVYIVIITRYSDYVPCSCGGILQKMGWNQHLVFNAVFTGLALLGIIFYKPPAENSQAPVLVFKTQTSKFEF